MDGPRERYRRQRALGATEELALAVVVSSYGLSHNIVRLDPAGKDKPVEFKWTLAQVCHVHFLWDMHRQGKIGGPND